MSLHTIARICPVSGRSFVITPEEQQYYQDRSLPLPTLHPFERARRRMSFAPNLTTVYTRSCAATGASLLSYYAPSSPVTVYDRAYWFSDAFDPMQYGRDIDFSRPFFEQFAELFAAMPRPHAMPTESENSDYVLLGFRNKNCYLMSGVENEDSFYSGSIRQCKEVADCYNMYSCELCFESLNCEQCYKVRYSFNAKSCRESDFLYDCTDCTNCFMCVGLKHKEYHIKNVAYTKEEYAQKIALYHLYTHSAVTRAKEEFAAFLKTCDVRSNNNVHCEDTLGDYMKNAQHCFLCYQGSEAVESRYCMPLSNRVKYCYDTSAAGAEYCVEVASGKAPVSCAYSYELRGGGSNMYYCADIYSECHNMFGCVGIKSPRQYCILNKQYTKEEYEQLLTRLIAHMKQTGEYGEFFPMWLSLLPYEDSVAQEYQPLPQTYVPSGVQYGLLQGHVGTYTVHVKSSQVPTASTTASLPNAIEDDARVYTEQEEKRQWLLQTIHTCSTTGRPYKITAPELSLYIKMGVPIPKESVFGRYPKLSSQVMRFELFTVPCVRCQKMTYTTMDSSRFHGMICEQCVTA